jgi:hypothetical protein
MRAFDFSVPAIAVSVALTSAAASASPEKEVKASPAPIEVVEIAKGTKAKSPPDFAAMLAFMDKLFPPQADPDPARLALARTSVAAMWPDGAYGKMMTGFMGGMFDRAMQLKKSDLNVLDDKKAKTAAAASSKDLSLHEQAAAKDPYFDQRVAAIREAVGEELGKVSAIIDPRVREGLARSMARRFDAQQLADINRFYATPSGRALASQTLQLWLDPDMMRSIFASMPEMMKLMPEMMQKLKAANDKFPKPPATPASAARH